METEKTIDQLKGEIKMLKIISIALTVVIVPLITITIYGLKAKENNGTFLPLLVVAFCCGSFIPINYLTIIKLKKEIALREHN